jgi:hypothetical protein
MKWTGTIKPISIDVPTDLHKKMKSVAPDRGLSVSVAYQRAATEWLEARSTSSVDSPAEPQANALSQGQPQEAHNHVASEDERLWMDILRVILDSGHEAAINAVTHNLYAFELLSRPGKGGSSNREIPKVSDLATDEDLAKIRTRIERTVKSGRTREPHGHGTPPGGSRGRAGSSPDGDH